MYRLIRSLSATFLAALAAVALFAFIAQPGIVILVLWVAAEAAAYDSDFRSFDVFALSRAEDAELRGLLAEAAETASTLAEVNDLDRTTPESDHLVARYLQLQTQILDLTERPPARLRRWSFRRGGRFALRLTLVVGVAIGGGLIYEVLANKLTLADGRRYFDVFLYVWSATALPLALGSRRAAYERALGDVANFLAHWDIGTETIDAHVNALLRERRFRPEDAPKSEHRRPDPPHENNESAFPAKRPKRPWHVVLEVDPTADQETIHKAYRHQVWLHHPHRMPDMGAELKDLAETITREIIEAYQEAKLR